MRTNDWLKAAQTQLETAAVETARLDSLLLLEHVSGYDRAWLLAHPEHELSAVRVTQLEKLLNQRAQHVPIAQLRGKSEFYGREFLVTPNVLEPRPESETIIELLKELSRAGHLPTQPRIADVGAGTGCLGITAALELPQASVDLIEIDKRALQVVQTNVDLFTSTAQVLRSDLLADTHHDYDVLLCNLPYVPDDYPVNAAARHEPAIALFGGHDGLDLYRTLFEQASESTKQPLYILTESLPEQHQTLAIMAVQYSYKLTKTDDFIQLYSNQN